jgi:hypothetical protein
MTRVTLGPWLADIAANVLAITLLVLIALGRITASEPAQAPTEVLTPQRVTPIGGAAAVELLRQRLLPQAAGYLDVTKDLPPLPDRVTALFVLDPAGYPAAVAALQAAGAVGWRELTVPEALKTPDRQWEPAFLALADLADDPDRFRVALQNLLVTGGGDRHSSAAAALAGDPLPSRFRLWFTRALDVLGLLALGAALWGLTRLRRWAVTA